MPQLQDRAPDPDKPYFDTVSVSYTIARQEVIEHNSGPSNMQINTIRVRDAIDVDEGSHPGNVGIDEGLIDGPAGGDIMDEVSGGTRNL